MSSTNEEYLDTIVGASKNSTSTIDKSVEIDLTFSKDKKPKKTNFSLHLTDEVYQALDRFSHKNRVSKSQVVEKILRQVLKV